MGGGAKVKHGSGGDASGDGVVVVPRRPGRWWRCRAVVAVELLSGGRRSGEV